MTAAEILGNIKAADAIKPLFKTVIDPNKADIAATAIVAMVKMGKDSMNTLIDALLAKDKEIEGLRQEQDQEREGGHDYSGSLGSSGNWHDWTRRWRWGEALADRVGEGRGAGLHHARNHRSRAVQAASNARVARGFRQGVQRYAAFSGDSAMGIPLSRCFRSRWRSSTIRV